MNSERKRVASSNPSRNGVVIGSVWESRMRGSFKVFNGDSNNQESETISNEITQMEGKKKVVVSRSKQSSSSSDVINGGGKRKTWKSEPNAEENPVQINKPRSENKKDLTEIKKNPPIQMKNRRPEWNNSKRAIRCASLPAISIPDESKNDIQEIKQEEELDNVGDEKLMAMEDKEENQERAIVVVQQMEPNCHKTEPLQNPISETIRKQPPAAVNHPRIISKSNELPPQRPPKSHNKLQAFVDLIMWKDVSKSSLIFGIGTFSILSSSYTQDLNISIISVISYLSLIYLAAIFIFRSFIIRGVVEKDHIKDDDEEEFVVVGEEEAIWAVKIFLPYINAFLLKVKALFSGDPSTTMKLAVLLFILARFGSSITIWKMAKLGFLGVFTVPKICSSYSSQFTAYGTFWVGRLKDAWESCSQKKAVALGIFTLVWNLSSIVARIWAVFMLLVAFKYYQQSTMKDEVILEEEPLSRRNQSCWQVQRNEKTGSTKVKKRT